MFDLFKIRNSFVVALDDVGILGIFYNIQKPSIGHVGKLLSCINGQTDWAAIAIRGSIDQQEQTSVPNRDTLLSYCHGGAIRQHV